MATNSGSGDGMSADKNAEVVAFNSDPHIKQAHVVFGVSIGLASIFLLVRFLAKWKMRHRWTLEDLACLIGFVIMLTHATLTSFFSPKAIISIRQLEKITASDFPKEYIEAAVLPVALYGGSILFIKLSLFLLYYRLFKPNAVSRRLIYVGMSLCTVVYIGCFIADLTLCNPALSYGKDVMMLAYKVTWCSKRILNLTLAQATFGVVSDIYILTIPLFSVSQLQISRQKKLGVSAVFFVGIVACACSIGSLGCRVKLFETYNMSYLMDAYLLGDAELSAGIICSSAPFLPGLFRQKEVQAPFTKILPRTWWPSSPSSAKSDDSVPLAEQQRGPIRNLHREWTQETKSGFATEERSAEAV